MWTSGPTRHAISFKTTDDEVIYIPDTTQIVFICAQEDSLNVYFKNGTNRLFEVPDAQKIAKLITFQDNEPQDKT